MEAKAEDKLRNLEEHALKRDRRFIVRLVSCLIVAFIAGMFLFTKLTSKRTAGCAADVLMGGDEQPGTPAPP